MNVYCFGFYYSEVSLFLICCMYTLVYLIAEQAVISEQDGILQKKVKRAGYNKRAGWNILLSKITEQVEFHSKEPSLMHCRVRKP